ncbi:hypothetical protein FRB99_001782, partial [Tulasnella sp. 403]
VVDVKRRRNRAMAIFCLPNEILLTIFRLCVPPDRFFLPEIDEMAKSCYWPSTKDYYVDLLKLCGVAFDWANGRKEGTFDFYCGDGVYEMRPFDTPGDMPSLVPSLGLELLSKPTVLELRLKSLADGLARNLKDIRSGRWYLVIGRAVRSLQRINNGVGVSENAKMRVLCIRFGYRNPGTYVSP